MSEEQGTEQKREIDDLAQSVGDVVVAERIQRRTSELLQNLMELLKVDVKQKALESLLLYRGRVAQKRDEEWSRAMIALWTKQDPHSLVIPTNPYELQSLIKGYQMDRERQLAVEKYRDGLSVGYKEGLQQGVKFGFGASEMGKSLDEALLGSRKLKPSF